MSKFYYFKKRVIFICIFFIVLVSQVFDAEATAMIKVMPNVTDNEVVISVEYTGNNMCGGSFNFTYDTATLRIVSAEEGEAIQNTTHFINPEFADGVIRVNWVSTTEMPTEGNLINIKFEMLDGTFKKSDIGIEKLKIADGNGDKQDADYIIAYEDSEQPAPPAEGETEDDSSIEHPGIENENGTGNGGRSSKSSSGIKFQSTNLAVKQEAEVNTTIEFTDVKETDWFYTNIKYIVDNNLMKGISETVFAPNNTLTRSMLVTILYRNEGEPYVNKSIPFADIDMGSWYANAVVWAKQNYIVNGVNDTEFAPNSNITREQIATIMFRYAQYKGMDAVTTEEILRFTDVDAISEYAVSAMNWAVGIGIINGKTDTCLNPKDNATRAEIATILHRFIENNK